MSKRASKVSPIAPPKRGFNRRKLTEIVEALNPVLLMRGGRGIRVIPAEAGFVIEFYSKTASGLPSGTGSGSGTLNWRGVWSSAETYQNGDIVIRPTAEQMEILKAGTFVSKVDDNLNQEPPALPDVENAYWHTLAKGSWERIYVRDSTGAAGKTDLVGGRAHFDFGNESRVAGWDGPGITDPETMGFPSAKIRTWPLAHDEQKGQVCTWRLVYAVDPSTVTARKLYVLAMEVP
jgi:hypothetical protein